MQSKNRKYILGIGILLLILIAIVVFIVLRATRGSSSQNGGGGGFFGGIFPDTGGGGNGSSQNGGNNGGTDNATPTPGGGTPLTNDEAQRLVQLTKDPIVGATTKYKEDKVLYFKRGVGHIFEIPFDGKTPEERLVQFTIPNILGVEWSPKRTFALISALGENSLKYIWINFTSTSTIESGFLQPMSGNIIDTAFSPAEDKIALTVQGSVGSAVFISDPKGKNPRPIFSLPVFDLTVDWVSKNLLSLETRPSAESTALLATVDPTGKGGEVLLSDVPGLDVRWDSTGSQFFSLETKNAGREAALSIRDRKTPANARPFPLLTLPEKCVFARIATSTVFCAVPKDLGRLPLPDSWWQGKVSFSDKLWQTNLATKQSSPLLQGGDFDMINLFLSDDERYLFFINKKDSALWSLRLVD